MDRTKEIEKAVEKFTNQTSADQRYASFDYCYNFFRSRERNTINTDLEKGCAVLGYYLASWGMMRASSFLLQKSYHHLIPIVKYLNSLDKSAWDINPEQYVEKASLIHEIYNTVRSKIIDGAHRHKVLVTKVMLGALGIVPAYDEFFCAYFKKVEPAFSRFSKFDDKSLLVIQRFYVENRATIDRLAKTTFTMDFSSGEKVYSYPPAKIIDMVGFATSIKK